MTAVKDAAVALRGGRKPPPRLVATVHAVLSQNVDESGSTLRSPPHNVRMVPAR